MTERFLKIGAVIGAGVVALLLVSGLHTSSTALAFDSTATPAPAATPTATPDPLLLQEVDTNAVVTGVGVPPNIECKWELPDMQVGVTDTTYPDPDMQYQLDATTGAHVHDDDMAVVPSVSPACALPTSGVGAPTQPNGVHNMIQVVPVPQDLPEERQIQLWMAVDHPNGISNISDVFWQVFHPDGSEKVQVHGTKIPQAACDPALGDSAAVGLMFEAAVHTGQVSAAAVDDVNYGMNAKCLEGVKAIYYASFDLSKHQPCGEYKIDATALNLTGMPTTLTNYIDVECVFYLKIDFDQVNWGAVTPGYGSVVAGDLIWDVPADNAPTVRNVGNDGMGLSLIFSKMVGASFGKEIIAFDACYGKTPSTLQCIGTDPLKPWEWIQAGVLTPFDNAPERVLCSDEDAKLDLSIHPPASLVADTYTGTLTVIGRHVAGLCQAE